MTDAKEKTKPDEDSGFLGGFLHSIYDKVAGKFERMGDKIKQLESDFIDTAITPLVVMALEALKGFFCNTLGWSTFGNGGMGARMVDQLENAFRADGQPAQKPTPTLAPAPQAPGMTPR